MDKMLAAAQMNNAKPQRKRKRHLSWDDRLLYLSTDIVLFLLLIAVFFHSIHLYLLS